MSAFSAIDALAGITGATSTAASGSLGGVTGVTGTSGADATASASGTGFAATLTSSLDKVASLQSTSADLAVKAATGDLTDVHDYTIAAAQAQLATQVTVAVRDKALAAFTQIMQMGS